MSGRAMGLCGSFLVCSVVLGVAWQRCLFGGCPDVQPLNNYRPGVSATLLDRNGQRYAELAPVDYQMVPLLTLPKYVAEAFIAVEDRRFRSHHGVDLRRVVGALIANLRSGRVGEGSSTISMQLARNLFPDRLPADQRTLGRKLLEARVAQQIEHEFSKDQILEMYLNHIYFGSGARGIQAAAHHYFGLDARELTLPQAALLAGLPKAPNHYDPRRNPKLAQQRRDLILRLMEQQQRVTPAQARQARASVLGVAPLVRTATAGAEAAYFVQEVRRQLEDTIGDLIHEEPLQVTTTLELGAQSAAEEEVERQLRLIEEGKLGRFKAPRFGEPIDAAADHTPYLQGAFIALEAGTGDVLAWVGGRNFEDSRFDRVKNARRQAGSAFKPFVYAQALESGSSLTHLLSDEPLRLQMDATHTWEPRNFDHAFEGNVNMRDALVRSKNVPTVRLAAEIGVHNVALLALRAGIDPPISEEPSMALGTVAVSPLEIAAAYTAFAAQGTAVKPRLLLEVKRADGTLLWKAPEPERRPVLEPATAFMLTDVLREALLRGTGTAVRAAGFVGPAAGKTGTTNDGADAWFVGYTPDVVAAAWIGFDERQPIVARATGGRLAAPVWAKVMLRLYQKRPLPPSWPMPDDVVAAMIDPATGFPLTKDCTLLVGAARRELFRRTAVPGSVCPDSAPPVALEASFGDEPSDDEERIADAYVLPVRPLPDASLTPAEAAEAVAAEPAHSYTPKLQQAPAPAAPGAKTPPPPRRPAAERRVDQNDRPGPSTAEPRTAVKQDATPPADPPAQQAAEPPAQEAEPPPQDAAEPPPSPPPPR